MALQCAWRRAGIIKDARRLLGVTASLVPLRGLHSRPGGHYDVIIAGGGIMGCSSAYFLAKRMPGHSVCIIERDPKYDRASTVLSVGSIRQQFSIRGNIQMSMYSCDFIRDIGEHLGVEGNDPPDVQFVEGGYLFLASREGEEILRENYGIQRSVGAAVELLSPPQLKEKFPWLNTDGLALGCHGVRNEGWFDPWSLLSAFRKKSISMGVHYLHGELETVGIEENRVKNVEVTLPNGERQILHCNYLVNAGGPWASQLARLAGVGHKEHPNSTMQVDLPVRPRKRMVFVFKCPNGPVDDCPLVVDPSGVYMRREGAGGVFISGCSPPEHNDPGTDSLDIDHSFFDKHIWPIIARRVPAFESLKVQSAWAGFYDYNTFDQNGIIGPHDILENFIFANGFSGHGIQQSPAVGRAVSEIIMDGRSHSIDLSEFSFHRVVIKQPLKERNIV